MAKPIFIVELPGNVARNQIIDAQTQLQEKMKDYYVLVIQSKCENPNFQAFYEKDFDKVKYNELKEFINNKFKTLM